MLPMICFVELQLGHPASLTTPYNSVALVSTLQANKEFELVIRGTVTSNWWFIRQGEHESSKIALEGNKVHYCIQPIGYDIP